MSPRGVLFTVLAVVGLGLGLAGLPGCASTPSVPVPMGSRIVVRLHDGETGVTLALANESYPELSGLYSRSQGHATMKLAPDKLIGELLYSLDHVALADYGQDGRPAELRGKESYLFVEQDGRETVFPKPGPAAPIDARRAFTHIKLVMNEYYRHVGSKQFVENPDGADIFRTQQ